jgi:hypothetical protein
VEVKVSVSAPELQWSWIAEEAVGRRSRSRADSQLGRHIGATSCRKGLSDQVGGRNDSRFASAVPLGQSW